MFNINCILKIYIVNCIYTFMRAIMIIIDLSNQSQPFRSIILTIICTLTLSLGINIIHIYITLLFISFLIIHSPFKYFTQYIKKSV